MNAAHGVEHRSEVVVIADLGGEAFARQSETFTHKTITEGRPIVFRIGHMMGIVVAGGAAELGRNGASTQLGQLLLETIDEHSHLFAQPCGRSRLTVRLGEHRDGIPFVGARFEGGNHAFEHRQIDGFEAVFEHQRESGVVDVLRSETEVYKLFVFLQTADGIELLFDEVFDGFHVVVRHTLDGFHALCVAFRKGRVDIAQAVEKLVIESGELGQRELAERDEVLNFNADAVFHQCVF